MVGVVAVVFVAGSSAGGISLVGALVPLISVLAGLATVVGAIVMYMQGRDERVKRSEHRREQIQRLQQDFYGDERPGVPKRSGVLEMLDNLTAQVATIHAEITPNHGGSMKDAIGRIDMRLEAVETDVKSLHDQASKGS